MEMQREANRRAARPARADRAAGRSGRNPDLYGEAAQRGVAQPQLAAVERDLLRDDRQPEPGAARVRAGPPRERLEQPLSLLRRDPRTVVGDAQQPAAVLAREVD